MIALAPILAALKGSGTPFKFVGGAIDLVTAGDHLKSFPSVYALPMQDAASENQSASYMALVQSSTERFGLMVAVRNLRPGAGEKAQEDLRIAVEWARSAVLGLNLGTDYDLVQLEGGEMVSFADEIAIWNDRYVTTRQLRKA